MKMFISILKAFKDKKKRFLFYGCSIFLIVAVLVVLFIAMDWKEEPINKVDIKKEIHENKKDSIKNDIIKNSVIIHNSSRKYRDSLRPILNPK